MAGVRIEITVDDAEVQRTLGAIEAKLGPAGLTELLGALGEYLLGSTRDRAALEVGPDGATWPALSPRYAVRKQKQRPNLPMLVWDRHLLGDRLAWQVDGDTLRVGTSAPYGAIQQFGGTIHIAARGQYAYFHRDTRTGEVGNQFVKKSKSNFAQGVNLPAYTITIPARPWLGVSAADRTEIQARILDFLRDAAGDESTTA